MTKEEFAKLAKKKELTADEYAGMSAKELAKWNFLNRQNTEWAEPYGGVVPYYPQVRHIEKNLAPEKDLSHMQIEALAHANQIARSNKLMSSSLADKMLPTALVESATGVTSWGYPDTPKYRAILTKAGLPSTLKEINGLIGSNNPYDDELVKTKMMHAVMAAKAAQYGEDKALERWNGKGASVNGANSENHVRKVNEAIALLQHPKNKELISTWGHYSNVHNPKTGTTQELRNAPESSSWSDAHVPAVINTPANAIESGLQSLVSSNPLQKMQQAIRNWTAPPQFLGGKDGN